MGQNPKIEYQEFNELQTLKRSKKQLCDRTGIVLGTFGRNGCDIKQPMSVRDRHTYIIGKSGSGKTNLIRTMILQDLEFGNGVGVLAPELELLTEEIRFCRKVAFSSV